MHLPLQSTRGSRHAACQDALPSRELLQGILLLHVKAVTHELKNVVKPPHPSIRWLSPQPRKIHGSGYPLVAWRAFTVSNLSPPLANYPCLSLSSNLSLSPSCVSLPLSFSPSCELMISAIRRWPRRPWQPARPGARPPSSSRAPRRPRRAASPPASSPRSRGTCPRRSRTWWRRGPSPPTRYP